MLAESRTTIKSWIERIVGSDVSVYCDFVPDYESSLISFQTMKAVSLLFVSICKM